MFLLYNDVMAKGFVFNEPVLNFQVGHIIMQNLSNLTSSWSHNLRNLVHSSHPFQSFNHFKILHRAQQCSRTVSQKIVLNKIDFRKFEISCQSITSITVQHISKFCSEHSIITAVIYAKFQDNWTTETWRFFLFIIFDFESEFPILLQFQELINAQGTVV